jgi:hypothetical protein
MNKGHKIIKHICQLDSLLKKINLKDRDRIPIDYLDKYGRHPVKRRLSGVRLRKIKAS